MKQHCPFLNKHTIYLIDVKLDYAKFFKTPMKELAYTLSMDSLEEKIYCVVHLNFEVLIFYLGFIPLHKRGEDEFNLG
jgi:hypothetical protein